MDVYEKLREILDAHPTGAPKSKAFDEILRILFAPEEAAIALHMNFSLKPVKAISAASGFPIHKAEKMLEAMADRVVVFSREKEGEKSYGLSRHRHVVNKKIQRACGAGDDPGNGNEGTCGKR
jgi:hypothetical protein